MLAPSRNKKWKRAGGVFTLIVAAIGVAILALSLFSRKAPAPSATSNPPFVITEISSPVVATSFQHKNAYEIDPASRILLVPHHLVAGREIASLLSSSFIPQRVLLLSPDHFTKGKQALSITRRPFSWNGQTIAPNERLIATLSDALPQALQTQDDVFVGEHGIRGLLPFLSTAWPEADVTAVTVRVDTSTTTMQKLAQTLQAELARDPTLLIVVTIDFSHELPGYLADLHDAQAITQLQALNAAAFDQVEIDSPPLFFFLATLAKLQQATLRLHAHTNSLYLMNTQIAERGTSHLLMSAVSKSNPTPLTKRFTLFHDVTRTIVSSENRAYRGYDGVREVVIPFPAIFVQEATTSTPIWHALPLRNMSETSWELVSDRTFKQLASERTQWETWARTHLSTK